MGKNLVYVPECHSTNSLASDLFQRTSPSEGTIIITDNQVKGRGQRGNEWFSQPKMNLTFSVILRPTFLRPSDQFNLTIAISLAIRDFLTHRLDKEVKIKWPNDILVNNKKLCGILIENSLARDSIQYSIVGIGLNVNQDSFVVTSASSMKVIAGQSFILTDELSLLAGFLEQRYFQLRSGKLDVLRKDYLNSLYGIGELRKFNNGTVDWFGRIEGVNTQGKLLIQAADGIKSFDLKEIRFVE